jgi:hypothetical protein
MGKLSDNERKVITERICGLRLEHMQAGISTQSMVICDKCQKVKPLVGSARSGPYRLCNDCALGYELAKAVGDIKSIEDFIPASRSTRQA